LAAFRNGGRPRDAFPFVDTLVDADRGKKEIPSFPSIEFHLPLQHICSHSAGSNLIIYGVNYGRLDQCFAFVQLACAPHNAYQIIAHGIIVFV
jgi:hypothetical protein